MAYIGKTNWQNNEIVLPADMNRIEQGISDADVALSEHLLNLLNPHGTTKAQVGLSEVANYGVASKAQAEAGTVSDKYMTPERTKQAINTLQAVKSVASKTGDVVLTKADVGLGNVTNDAQMRLSGNNVISNNSLATRGNNSNSLSIAGGISATIANGAHVVCEGVDAGGSGQGGSLFLAAGGGKAVRCTSFGLLFDLIPTRINNGEFQYYDGGWKSMVHQKNYGIKEIVSPTTIAGTWVTVLNVSGGCIIEFAMFNAQVADTGGVLQVEITVDGVTKTYNIETSAVGRGAILVGSNYLNDVTSFSQPQNNTCSATPIVAKSSLLIRARRTAGTANKGATIVYRLEM